MIVLSWNIGGLGCSAKRAQIRKICKSNKVEILTIQERKLQGINMSVIDLIWGTSNKDWVSLDAVGYADEAVVDNLQKILVCFEVVSGLRINITKSEMLGIRLEERELGKLASLIGCKTGSFPSTYLVMPLCLGKPPLILWDRVIEKVERKLSIWESQYLSLGGRLTLIKVVLPSMPIYIMSLFKCPKSVLNRLKKLQQDFLWYRSANRSNFHLLNWNDVCCPLEDGGAGIRDLDLMNITLLGKWLWRLAQKEDTLWKVIIENKYGLSKGGWGRKAFYIVL
ncbi:uncharacterized protein LOC131235665 [Magnolia sinica]|uniref:uncharacterized protein LOC131235665 n=1 Tax=Magnolia sinica TaxID=86752 RepID=UPI002657C199|nr:uncharacterized protein LOC131235665 [Magnolia sinica]